MMILPSSELADILRSDLPNIAPAARAACEASIEQVERRGLSASSHNRLARSINQSLQLSAPFIRPEFLAKLRSVTLLAAPIPYIGAVARVRRGMGQIVIFAGILRLVQFFFEMLNVSSRLQAVRPEATIDDGLGGQHSDSFLFLLACQVLMSAFMERGEEPVSLSDMLSEEQNNTIAFGFNGALCFLLLHELGHIELGHTALGMHSEPMAMYGLLEPEDLSNEQAQEFDADDYALEALNPQYRAGLISSLIHLFGSFALLEAFVGSMGDAHPLSINRLGRLAEQCDLDETERAVTDQFVKARVNFFREMTGRREAAGGSLAGRIYKVMSVEHARRVIEEVRRRVEHDHGKL